MFLKSSGLPQVIPELVTERGMALQRGDPVAAKDAMADYRAGAERLVLATKRKKRQKVTKHCRYRVKSYKLGMSLDANMAALGLGGFSRLKIGPEQLADAGYAHRWAHASVISDKGPDCMCLRAYLLHKLGLNLDWTFDPCHGAHHSASHGLQRAGLKTHSLLMCFAYNIGLGEWKDQKRREQIVQSMTDTMSGSN